VGIPSATQRALAHENGSPSGGRERGLTLICPPPAGPRFACGLTRGRRPASNRNQRRATLETSPRASLNRPVKMTAAATVSRSGQWSVGLSAVIHAILFVLGTSSGCARDHILLQSRFLAASPIPAECP
jgi:hypothetical protein